LAKPIISKVLKLYKLRNSIVAKTTDKLHFKLLSTQIERIGTNLY
jgi:hypothetical protein